MSDRLTLFIDQCHVPRPHLQARGPAEREGGGLGKDRETGSAKPTGRRSFSSSMRMYDPCLATFTRHLTFLPPLQFTKLSKPEMITRKFTFPRPEPLKEVSSR